jgi:hypothetical protein
MNVNSFTIDSQISEGSRRKDNSLSATFKFDLIEVPEGTQIECLKNGIGIKVRSIMKPQSDTPYTKEQLEMIAGKVRGKTLTWAQLNAIFERSGTSRVVVKTLTAAEMTPEQRKEMLKQLMDLEKSEVVEKVGGKK